MSLLSRAKALREKRIKRLTDATRHRVRIQYATLRSRIIANSRIAYYTNTERKGR